MAVGLRRGGRRGGGGGGAWNVFSREVKNKGASDSVVVDNSRGGILNF